MADHNALVITALNLTDRHASQVSPAFMIGMANRMALSFEKYGHFREAYPHKVDAIESGLLRLKKYRETGNTEYLMDAANFMMIEFMAPKHANAHFKAEDSGTSPGRVGTDGTTSAKANTIAREKVRTGEASNWSAADHFAGTSLSTAGGRYKREGD
jgi:hypothetical protein